MPAVAETFDQALRCHQAGAFAAAEQLYRQVLEAAPQHVDALYLLGMLAYQAGQSDRALECVGTALRFQPDCAEAHTNLGIILLDRGRVADAEACFRQALSLKPGLGEAHNSLGVLLLDLGKREEAVACFRQALALQPGNAQLHNNLGLALQREGQLEEAAGYYGQALRLNPGLAEVHTNLGLVLRKQGRREEAEDRFRQALRLKPSMADAHNNLGGILQEQLRLDEAVSCFQQAIALQPDYVEAHGNLGMTLLLMGQFEQGWREYVWHGQLMGRPLPNLDQPVWNGAPLDSQTILLSADWGLGDTLQFIRYATLVHERGARVLVGCRRELQRLLGTCPGIAGLIPEGQALPAFDVHAPLLRLPGIFGTTLDNIPTRVPYLDADPLLVAGWRQQLESGGFKVGIVWQGSLALKDDPRAVPLPLFATLAQVPQVRLYSLQKGPGVEQLAGIDFPVKDVGSRLDDFVDTAALLKSLDLVVTMDTAVAHCAGALGVPVWVALPFVPDWRWLLDREDSPWYPTMRLFRQQQPGQWTRVFDRIAGELRHLAAYGLSRYPSLHICE